jgi:hypothetical protein
MQALFSRALFPKAIFSLLLCAGAALGAITGTLAMYLWQPFIQISLLAGAFPSACYGVISTLIASETAGESSYSERGFV